MSSQDEERKAPPYPAVQADWMPTHLVPAPGWEQIYDSEGNPAGRKRRCLPQQDQH